MLPRRKSPWTIVAGPEAGRFARPASRPTRLYRWDLARLVQLPQAPEAPQLALQVAGGPAEALEAHRPPVDRVDLDERVDQLLGDPSALLGRVQRGGNARDDHLALDPLHHVERAADRGGVLAHREHLRHARRGVLQRPQQARLAQHVVSAGWQRRTGRAAQDHLGSPALDQVGHVRVALADRARFDLPLAEAVLVQEAPRAARARAGAGVRSACYVRVGCRRCHLAQPMRSSACTLQRRWADRRARPHEAGAAATATSSVRPCLSSPCSISKLSDPSPSESEPFWPSSSPARRSAPAFRPRPRRRTPKRCTSRRSHDLLSPATRRKALVQMQALGVQVAAPRAATGTMSPSARTARGAPTSTRRTPRATAGDSMTR